MLPKIFQVLIISQLHLVTEVDDIEQILLIVQFVVHSILNATVEIDGEHTLRARRHATGTQRIAETIVLNLVTQTAAAGK